MQLLELPTELIESIAQNVDSSADLNALCRTSRRFYRILDKHLYSRDARQGCRALRWSAKIGITTTLRKSLKHGVDVNYLDSKTSYTTPLLLAAQGGHVDIVRLLLAHGGNPDIPTTWYDTPLLSAIHGGYYEVVKALLEKGADMYAKDEWFDTPLQAAVSRGQDNIVELLLKKGVLADDPQRL
ncbi:ankyrin repeat-containing domain protein [Ilyonectria robusta]|uniref:ankyrin repeat-containing domain protein n=1 Tax=Ilyonectria robusta TaxID=1079257 RepID=UPI001E8D1D3F|nr:ankyrin repeat-containing domain protein [Ilyonectria robusta]KAH8662681.1 ankyrin repeat-containing domain protein [Ilyonectria robusta]